jgi:hypothetical protein
MEWRDEWGIPPKGGRPNQTNSIKPMKSGHEPVIRCAPVLENVSQGNQPIRDRKVSQRVRDMRKAIAKCDRERAKRKKLYEAGRLTSWLA